MKDLYTNELLTEISTLDCLGVGLFSWASRCASGRSGSLMFCHSLRGFNFSGSERSLVLFSQSFPLQNLFLMMGVKGTKEGRRDDGSPWDNMVCPPSYERTWYLATPKETGLLTGPR